MCKSALCLVLVVVCVGSAEGAPLAPNHSSLRGNLCLWLRTPESTYDPGAGIWTDLSGKGNDARADVTGFVGPALSSGENAAVFSRPFSAVHFSPTAQELLRATNLNGGAGLANLTVFSVVKLVETGGVDQRPVGFGAYTAGILSNCFDMSFDVTVRKNNGSIAGKTQDFPVGQYVIYAARMDPSVITMWFNSTGTLSLAFTATGSSYTTSTDEFYVGDLRYTPAGDFDVAEVVVFNTALTDAQVAGVSEWLQTHAGIKAKTAASGARPADGATDISRDVTLLWTPVESAIQRDVYFGAAFEDVNNADRAHPTGVLLSRAQTATTFNPGRLEFGTTYYWRIDEVNSAPDGTIFKGDTWSFTTEPVAYPIAGGKIFVSASSSASGQGPENTVNGSGLTGDLHSDGLATMWLSATGATGPAWIQYEFDKVYKLAEMWVWNHNGSLERAVGLGCKSVSVEYSVNGTDYTAVGTNQEFARASGKVGYAHNTVVDLGGIAAKYVRLTITSNWGSVLTQYGLSEVRFFSVPVLAREPSPSAGATNVDVSAPLSWRAGREAARHNVFISTDQQAVTNGTAAVQTVTPPSYAAALDLASTYYWRVDEVNEAQTPSLWQGDLWSFSTETYDVVDDFESYTNDSPKRVFQAWIDGTGFSPDEFFPKGNTGNGSGALVGYDPTLGPIMETKTVHGGKKAMPLCYGYGGKTTSEATRTFDSPQDWTKHGIRSLCLYFSGRTDNGGARLYVRINNGAKLFYPGDADDLKQPIWMALIADLATVGADLSSVNTLTIGVEGAAATGTLLIDDIGLYPMTGELITPAEPSTSGLLARFRLDGDAKDAAGSHDGTLVNMPMFVAGKDGQAMNVNLDQYVTIPYSADLSLNSFTVAAWVNVSDIAGARGILGTRFGGDQTFDLKVNATSIQGDIGDGAAWLNTAVTIPVVLSVGQWYHIAYAIDHVRGTAELYVNGLPARTIAITGTPLFMKAGQELRIGTSNKTEYMRGSIDEVRIYNRALPPAEVAGLAGRTAPLYKPF